MANVGQLEIFNHAQFGEIRTLVDNDGEPWFVATDVCQSLEIKNTTQAIQSLDDDERSMYNIGRQGKANIVNESGLFSLVFQSRKPEAKAFRKWVTSEVLPSIRKHGVYNVVQRKEHEGLTAKSFIEHDDSFWLSADIIADELSHSGIEDTPETISKMVMNVVEIVEDSMSGFITVIDGKTYVRNEGICFVAIMSVGEHALEFCKAVMGILGSLKGKDLAHVKIAAVRAYQEVVSRLNASGRDINFVRSLIRYKEKDLSVDEISVLTGQSRNDIAVYMEELESSGIMEMSEILTAVPAVPLAPAVQALPSAAVFANPTQEMIDKLGYNEAVVFHQLQTMIHESGKKRVQITHAEWLKRFPFKSQRTLQRALCNLEDKGIIQSRRLMVHYQRIKEYWIE